ncbi:MAG: tetratricopeptide repeat protein, partial [Candidatus Latescibacteria bacterium]|nr:tetratricopeptide repeat protein [Candidatus Latescibacterota bacterium]
MGGKNKKQSRLKNDKTSRLNIAAPWIIVALCVLAYSNSFTCSFQFDDFHYIVENRALHDIGDIGAIWNFLDRRFIGNLTFALNYSLHGVNVVGYHVVNLLVHIGAALFVRWLALLIFSTPVMRNRKISGRKELLSLACGLIFAVHPLQTQAVTYIVQRLASLAAFFYLGSICLYLKARLTQSRGKILFFSGSAVLGLLGLLTKEIVFTLPFAVILCEIYFFSNGLKPFLGTLFAKKRLVFLLPVIAFLLILPAMMSFRLHLITMATESDRYPDPELTAGTYLMTQFRVVVEYIRLLFVPVGQNVDHDLPAATGFFEPRIFISFLILASIITAAALLFRRFRIISFGIMWFFLTLSVESSIKPLHNVMFEHRLYLPMAGFVLVFTALIYHLLMKRNTTAAVGVLLAVIAAFSVLTVRRNFVWRTEISLWRDAVRKSPEKHRPYNNLGASYLREGNFSEAEPLFRKTLEINPSYPNAYYNLGSIAMKEGRKRDAEAFFWRAIKLYSGYFDAHHDLGLLLLDRGDFEGAVKCFRAALAIIPGEPTAMT